MKNWAQVVIAYEPIWAIGTGKSATPEEIQEAHNDIRKWLIANTSDDIGKKVRIIYGGTVNEKIVESIIEQEDVDGFLVHT